MMYLVDFVPFLGVLISIRNRKQKNKIIRKNKTNKINYLTSFNGNIWKKNSLKYYCLISKNSNLIGPT
jgi:hypothetical protein